MAPKYQRLQFHILTSLCMRLYPTLASSLKREDTVVNWVTSIAMDDKTGKMTLVGEVDVSRIVKKLRKICNAELVSVEVVKPSEKKPEPEKPAPAKPAEIVVPVTHFNYPYQYQSSYANSYYQPCQNYRVVVEEPNTCVIM
ncbi:hypothetical protein YC2023_015595 [Brassica napus]